MCELLGLNFNLQVSPSLSFRGFRHGSKGNPHGWGVARYEGKASQVFKEPVNAQGSRLAGFLQDYPKFRSSIIIGHVRYRSCGEKSLANTHPFVRTFRKKEIVLAHNGTLTEMGMPSTLKFKPIGETDSEVFFCHFLSRLSRDQINLEDFQEINNVLKEFNEFGKMNLLFSDGERLYVYHDKAGYNGLCYLERKAPFSRVSLKDEDWHVDLSEEKSANQRGFVVATRPLTDEKWQNVIPGTLVVLMQGNKIF